jgi:hypothetical protein
MSVERFDGPGLDGVTGQPVRPEHAATPVVKCELCGRDTIMTATRRCDFCWELERRIHRDPDIALGVLAKMCRGQARQTIADSYLLALMRYTAGFYASAIEHGMKAGETANTISHVERAARALHAMAVVPIEKGEP